METGILNFHDEETFSSSLYDPMDTVGSDQYSSDYLDAPDSHWGTEQELNGDIAVLPMECPPRHMRALHNREDYHRAFDEWQEHLMSLQPVGPDDLELDSHGFAGFVGFAADLHTTVFQDALSFTPEPLPSAPTEPLTSLPSVSRLSPIPPSPPSLSPTPSPSLPHTESALNESTSVSTDMGTKSPVFESPNKLISVKLEPEISDAELDESFLSLDISNVDEKALEELHYDIKGLANGASVTSILGNFKIGGESTGELLLPGDCGGNEGSLPHEGSLESSKNYSLPIKDEANTIDRKEIEQPVIKDEPLDLNGIENIGIKDELHLEIDSVDIDMNLLAEPIPVLEAGNLESLLEQFEATESGKSAEPNLKIFPNPVLKAEPVSPIKSQSGKSQSIESARTQPVVSVKPQSVISVKPVESVEPEPFSPVIANHLTDANVKKPARMKRDRQPEKSNKSSPSTNSPSQLHKDIRDALPAEVIDRIKACGRRKEIAIIPVPVVPPIQNSKCSSRPCKPPSRNQRNKTNQKAPQTNQIQLDHDYCGTKESTPTPVSAKFYNCDASEYTTATVVRSPNCKTTVQIQAKTVRRLPDYITIMGNNTKKDRKPGKSLLKSSLDWCDEKSSRKDSGLSSGDVSDDSECATLISGNSSGCETTGSTTIGRVKLANTPGKPKDLLMVSVLKKSSSLPVQPPTKLETTTSVCVTPETPVLLPVPEEQEPQSEVEEKEESKPKKRKLNLEEYRNRVLERQRSENEKIILPDTVDSATPVSLLEPSAPRTKGNDERSADGPVEQESPSETQSNVEAHTQTSSAEKSQPTEKRRRQYRPRRSTSSSSDSSVSVKQNQIASSNRDTTQKWCQTESKVRSRSRSRSKSCSGRKSRLKLRSSSVSSGSSSSRSRSSSTSSRSSSSSSSDSSSSSISSTSRSSRRFNRSSRRSSGSRNRYRDNRSRRRDRSHSRSSCRSRSHSWRRRSRSSKTGARRSFSRSRSRSLSRSRSRSYFKRRRSSGSRSYFSDTSRSCSRSRSRSRLRRYRRSRSRSSSRGGRGDTNGRRLRSRTRSQNWRSRSPISRHSNSHFKENERNREIEERRVVYVGRIPEETTKTELRRRFEAFGPIIDISLHFRERADNYGFVTFAYKADAYSAVERGNNDPNLPRYDLCFGGRRKFCRERYSDLDGLACKNSDRYQSPPVRPAEENSFDLLLRQAQAKLRKKKV